MDTVGYDDVVARLRADGCCIGVVADPDAYHVWKGALSREFGCPCVSKSSLAEFGESVYRHHWNAEHGGRKETAGMRLGSMVDCLALTPWLWDEKYTRPWEPEGKYARPWEPGEPMRFKPKRDGSPSKTQDPDQKAAWAEARERFEAEKAEQRAAFEADCEARGRVVLKDGEQERAAAVAAVATAAMEGNGLVLEDTCTSQVGMWVYLREIGGVELPCPVIVTGMIDLLPWKGSRLVDLKSTSADVEQREKLNYAVEDFHYGLGAALYIDLYALCTGDARDEFELLFVSTGVPPMARSVVLGGAVLDEFRKEYAQLVRGYAAAWRTGEWGSSYIGECYYQPTRREVSRFDRLPEVNA